MCIVIVVRGSFHMLCCHANMYACRSVCPVCLVGGIASPCPSPFHPEETSWQCWHVFLKYVHPLEFTSYSCSVLQQFCSLVEFQDSTYTYAVRLHIFMHTRKVLTNSLIHSLTTNLVAVAYIHNDTYRKSSCVGKHVSMEEGYLILKSTNVQLRGAEREVRKLELLNGYPPFSIGSQNWKCSNVLKAS